MIIYRDKFRRATGIPKTFFAAPLRSVRLSSLIIVRYEAGSATGQSAIFFDLVRTPIFDPRKTPLKKGVRTKLNLGFCLFGICLLTKSDKDAIIFIGFQ